MRTYPVDKFERLHYGFYAMTRSERRIKNLPWWCRTFCRTLDPTTDYVIRECVGGDLNGLFDMPGTEPTRLIASDVGVKRSLWFNPVHARGTQRDSRLFISLFFHITAYFFSSFERWWISVTPFCASMTLHVIRLTNAMDNHLGTAVEKDDETHVVHLPTVFSTIQWGNCRTISAHIFDHRRGHLPRGMERKCHNQISYIL
jgi:hypothetical protein